MQGNIMRPRWQVPTLGVPDRLNHMGLRFWQPAPAGADGAPGAGCQKPM